MPSGATPPPQEVQARLDPCRCAVGNGMDPLLMQLSCAFFAASTRRLASPDLVVNRSVLLPVLHLSPVAMSPAAAKRVSPKVEPEIVATVSSTGEVKPVLSVGSGAKAAGAAKTKASGKKAAAPKASPSKRAKSSQAGLEGGSLDAAADALLAAADGEASFDENDTLTLEADDKLDKDDKKDAKAKALASIKVGPKGVYTEDSIRVYLQEIGRIRLLRPDEEIELARKIADLLQLEELAVQFESDKGHYPDTKEWAALVEMPLIKIGRAHV